jgi:hypothetical protein
MKILLRIALVGVASVFIQATPVSILPSDDGYVSPSLVMTDDYVITGDEFLFGRGVLEFPIKDFKHNVESAVLAVNPYGLPLFATVMNVYGYESKNGRVDLSDYSAGELIGQWMLPADLNYGEEAFFDVTAFVRGVNKKYVGFTLQGLPAGGGYNVLSSLEFNLGTPSRLIVTPCNSKNHC